jgi:cytochrome c-type biogenesis protein
MLEVSYAGAALAGLLSFASPCVLPLVPPYLCFLGGVSYEALSGAGAEPGAARRILFRALAFVLGFTTVFVLLGLAAAAVGPALPAYAVQVAGAVIVAMGLHFLGLFRLEILLRRLSLDAVARPASLVGAYVVGLAFAFGWTPCAGPVLGAITTVAAQTKDVAQGGVLLAFYSVGIGAPFLAAAAAAPRFLRLMQRFRPQMRHVERAMGALLVATGLLLMLGLFQEIGFWLYRAFPVFERIG